MVTGEETALGFVGALRTAGVSVPVGGAIAYLQALSVLSGSREDIYWAGRSTLVTSPEQIGLYDVAFSAWWEDTPQVLDPVAIDEVAVVLATDDEEAPPGTDGEPTDGPVLAVRFSPQDVLRAKDFAEYDADELAEARRLMADLAFVGAPRRSRRLRSTRRRRGRPASSR